jgi:hypothetical protein
VPLQPIASTLASASSSAAARILLSSNWPSALAFSAISVTVKREKWALAPGTVATMALVRGSRAVFDEGVSTPRRMGVVMDQFLRSVGSSMACSGPAIHDIFDITVNISVNTNSSTSQRPHHPLVAKGCRHVAPPEPRWHLPGNSMKPAPESESRRHTMSTHLSALIGCQRRTRRARHGARRG